MDRTRTAINVAVLVVIALAVDLIPGGGRAASTFEAFVEVGLGAAIVLIGIRGYRERRVTIHGLGDRHRAILYGALALAAFEYAARSRMWETGAGEVAWFALLALVVYGGMEVFRHARAY